MLPGEFTLPDGTPALIWPLLPTDGRALREGFRQLSPQSRRRRFLSAVGELDGSLLRHLVDGVDGVHHIALVLTVLPPDGPEGPVGVARLVQNAADPATADIAVTVADEWLDAVSAPRWSRRCCGGAPRRSGGCARPSTQRTARRWRCSPGPANYPRASRTWGSSTSPST